MDSMHSMQGAAAAVYAVQQELAMTGRCTAAVRAPACRRCDLLRLVDRCGCLGGRIAHLHAVLLHTPLTPRLPRPSPPSAPLNPSVLQLADFLVGPMQRSGGIMPLPDVYCLYNRARGTELISPDDLISAVKLFPQVQAAGWAWVPGLAGTVPVGWAR